MFTQTPRPEAVEKKVYLELQVMSPWIKTADVEYLLGDRLYAGALHRLRIPPRRDPAGRFCGPVTTAPREAVPLPGRKGGRLSGFPSFREKKKSCGVCPESLLFHPHCACSVVEHQQPDWTDGLFRDSDHVCGG